MHKSKQKVTKVVSLAKIVDNATSLSSPLNKDSYFFNLLCHFPNKPVYFVLFLFKFLSALLFCRSNKIQPKIHPLQTDGHRKEIVPYWLRSLVTKCVFIFIILMDIDTKKTKLIL